MEHSVPPEEYSTQLLAEIRDSQQKLLAEYSRVANESLALQREACSAQQRAISQQAEAVEMQRKSARLYRTVLLVAAPVMAFLVWKLLELNV
jgi:hypothetical protein